jgi:hypothetical protein
MYLFRLHTNKVSGTSGDSLDKSRLWSRLSQLAQDDTEVADLQRTVRKVVEQAGTISGWIVKHLGQFTLHQRAKVSALNWLSGVVASELHGTLDNVS